MVDGKVFRGQTATVQIETNSGTEITVGALQDVEVGVEFEDEELMGQSIKVIDRQRTRVGVSVSASHGAFDVEGIKEIIGYDDTEEEIADSPEPPKFKVTAELESTDGNEHFTADITDVVFSELTLGWSRDEHVTEDLSGEGTDIQNITDQTA